jgi:hypothetical protein
MRLLLSCLARKDPVPVRFYFPIVTALIISVVLSLILWLLKPGKPVCNIFYRACS